ncbi:MAG: choline-sulfatase [Rhodobacteraceae bacterium]|nr:choline-sulfatase [Paracoccaceae bacterium]
MSKTPNIVLIMADQLAPQFTGAYGHPLVQTPHMDALAAAGTRFDAAYCNSPLCAPSRASFMTGQLPSRIAAYDNAADFRSGIPTFAHYLRQAGYCTCLSGKMHFVGPDQLHGFEERLTTDIYPSDHAWTPDWEAPGKRLAKWYHNMDAVRQAGQAATTFQIEYDEETAFFARRRIFEYAMQQTAPFAMVVSLIHPHDPYVARPEWWDLYSHDEIDLPDADAPPDPLSARVMRGIEADITDLSQDQIRNARHAYYANVSYFDSKVGNIVQALKESGQYDNTVVIVTSDHGDMLGDRGLWYKMTFFERSARVPLVVAGPGVAQSVVEAPVSLVDLLPTMLDIAAGGCAGAPAGGTPLDGRSLWPLAQGEAEGDREVIGEYLGEMADHPVLMIRRGDFKYVHCDGDPPQLYNLARDPGERHNLAVDPDHAELVAAFASDVAARWDSAALRADVIASQTGRRAVHAAMEQGAWTSWDYNPPRDATAEFVRNTVSWDDVLHRMQYPPPQSAG